MVLDFEPHTEDLRDDHLDARDALGDIGGEEEEEEEKKKVSYGAM